MQTAESATPGSPRPPSSGAEAAGPRASYRIAAVLFVRALAGVYLIAFASLWPQLLGLVGARGILPVSELLAHSGFDGQGVRFIVLPTLSWLSPTDIMVQLLCATGVVVALLVLAGVAPALGLGVMWLCYLSLVTDGQVFMGFQWDSLLLEAGFLAIFLAPRGIRPRRPCADAPSDVVLWLLRLLLFKLVLMSGFLKLASGDPTWRDLTALSYHYQTQPLPTWPAWFAFHLPLILQRLVAALTLAIEVLVPWLIFGPPRARRLAAVLISLFMLAIALTGNYGFFNVLTIVLCLPLVDDAAWPASMRTLLPPCASTPRAWPRAVTRALAIVVIGLTVVLFGGTVFGNDAVPAPIATLAVMGLNLRLVNPYGLFTVMTTHRPEVVVEGSNDGVTWREYGFKYKPGALEGRPRFVAPDMPRLDWQMWFAALSPRGANPWFERFLARLKEGAPDVLGLLAINPFPDRPPRYLRARLYEYRFSDPPALWSAGQWWQRSLKGDYGGAAP